MHLNHKHRWIFSPLVTNGKRETPYAAEYALLYEAPMHYNGFALTNCVMNAQQFAAASKDPKLIVLPSIHDRAVIPAELAAHHAVHGLTPTMLQHEALEQLSKYHPNFAPED
jgi:hypothetical protein